MILSGKRMTFIAISAALAVGLAACSPGTGANSQEKSPSLTEPNTKLQVKSSSLLNETGNTISERFTLPAGYERSELEPDSEEGTFAAYLRDLPLKAHGSKVFHYDGTVKQNTRAYTAVIDMDVGKKDLQQCADAVMRLRGEYLYQSGHFDQIRFHLTNGFLVDYSKWMQGYRVAVEGNETEWVKSAVASNTYEDFRKYMEFVFIYAGSLSLSLEMKSVPVTDMRIGDVLVQGGTPGHAVIVVDMAVHRETGKKLYMLAQSYMPAQNIQILTNPNDKELSPWYVLDDQQEDIRTPEWTFTTRDLKRF
ncbi:DUF4846 domain-containing protein [Paenibacillus harenae]|uniref:DUF4846 domain-containing protein n=1 Tax=Paenibacillus harenae TaxID=306543 RepID=UPI00040FD1BA|nr:DUF4846 domain-containing protein [Paenibacillus harenae]